MRTKVGEVAALFRYPVKSMGGETLETAQLGWHGVAGDRRLAFRRLGDRSGFPWLTASKIPQLILYQPRRLEADAADLPTHIRTPDGAELPLFGEDLAARIGDRLGSPVEMTHLNRGIFDEASISIISAATVEETCRMAELAPDVRRFRPNILLRTPGSSPFEEDGWVGGTLWFGDGAYAAGLAITNRDERCSMVCFDPDTARTDAELLKAIYRTRDNLAGVYAAVTRPGTVATGQAVWFEPAAGAPGRA